MRVFKTFLFIALLSIFNSCGIYSFTGIQINPDAKTFTVYPVINKALTVNTAVNFTIQQELISRLQSQTKLSEIRENGDLNYTLTVTEYSLKPIAVTAANTASRNRFRITVECVFENKIDKQNNFKRNYSVFRDFDSGQAFQSLEDEFIDSIVKEIMVKIINDSLVIW